MKKSPIQYIMQNPVNTTLTVIFILAFALTTIFLLSSQSDLRQENRLLKKENKSLETDNNTLKKQVSERDKVISEYTVRLDTLKKSLTVLNDQIITINEGSGTVSNLDLDGHIKLLADFISKTDTVRE